MMKTKIVLDAHFDMLLDVLTLRRRGGHAVMEERFLPGLRAAGVNAVVCSVFILDELVPEGALRNALDQISALRADLEESPSFALCRSAGECRAAAADGKVALFLSLEGAERILRAWGEAAGACVVAAELRLRRRFLCGSAPRIVAGLADGLWPRAGGRGLPPRDGDRREPSERRRLS